MRPPTVPTRSRWRYALILVVVCVAVVAAAAAGWRFARKSASASNGPVIVISIDSLRADRLRVYGHRLGRTPAIDALAHDGVVFERVYAHSPLALPSHVSLLSGRLPMDTGVRTDEDRVAPQTTLLPQMMKPLGYKTDAALSDRALAAIGPAFDSSDLPPAPVSTEQPSVRPDEQTIAAVRKWIGSLASPRFLVFVQLSGVAARQELDPSLQVAEAYDASVTQADESLGQFVKWLRGRGLYDRSTIVLLASHGEALGDHGEQGHGLFLYDATMRVPLIVKLSHGANHGGRVTDLAQLVDVPATILDLLDTAKPAGTAGRSLRRLAMGRSATEAEPPVYAESMYGHQAFGWSPLESVTDYRYRYIRAPHEELYDLREDVGETRNLATAHPDVVAAMRGTLARLHSSPIAGPAGNADGAAEPAGQDVSAADDRANAAARSAEVQADPKDKVAAYARFQSARLLASAGRLQEAVAAYRAFLATEPTCAKVWMELATFLGRVTMFNDAADAYGRVIKLAPENAEASLGAGYALMRSGKLDAARADARRASTLAPAAGHELLARIAVEANDWAEAMKEAELANQADPSLALPAMVRGVQLYRALKFEQALPPLQQAATARGARPGAMADLGGCLADTLARVERYADAEAAWKEQLVRFPYSTEARISLAMLYHAQHRDNDTEQVIQDLVRTIPTPEAYGAVARVWTIFGEKDRADAARAEARLKFGREAPVGRHR